MIDFSYFFPFWREKKKSCFYKLWHLSYSMNNKRKQYEKFSLFDYNGIHNVWGGMNKVVVSTI